MSAPAPEPSAIAAPAHATGVLSIDLGAIRRNYRQLNGLSGRAECASVIKADGYGLGAVAVARALAKEGCTSFFVAALAEAEAVRAAMPDVTIYVLDGLFPGTAPGLTAARAIPVLGSLDEIREWAGFCAAHGDKLPAAIHIDTGMNRLGLSPAEVTALVSDPALLAAFSPGPIISHLACADDPANAKNEAQRAAFDGLRARLPKAPASLANSAGIMLGAGYHYDLVRPGIALYGGRARISGDNPMEPVVTLQARIIQIRQAASGETVGYGAARRLDRDSRIATIAAGYADGYVRLLGSSDAQPGAQAHIGGHAVPVLGRVSMDLIALDVTDLPEGVAQRGGWAELIGRSVTVDDLAERAQTIGYEILTGLGRRFERCYFDSEAASEQTAGATGPGPLNVPPSIHNTG